MLSWDDFRIVRAIAETRSLSGAAAALGVNHSTVFRRLAQVEQQLGSRLFERSRARYEPTPCGEEMARLAQRMAEDIVNFERKVTGHDLRPSGELRVTTNDTLLVNLLTEILAGFHAVYPEIVIDVLVANEALNLSKRDADIALRATDRPPESLVGRRLCGIAWAVYASASMAGTAFDPARDARDFPWVGLSENLAGLKASKWLRDRVGEERMVYRLNTVLGLAEAAAAGIGLALLPCFIGDVTRGLVRLAMLDPPLETGLWLLTHSDLRQAARVRAFMDFTSTEIIKRRAQLEGAA